MPGLLITRHVFDPDRPKFLSMMERDGMDGNMRRIATVPRSDVFPDVKEFVAGVTTMKHQYMALLPTCWKTEGIPGRNMDIAKRKISMIIYRCNHFNANGVQCDAKLRALHPKPDDKPFLQGLGISAYAVYESSTQHDDAHAGLYMRIPEALALASPAEFLEVQNTRLTGAGRSDCFPKGNKKLPTELQDMLVTQAKQLRTEQPNKVGASCTAAQSSSSTDWTSWMPAGQRLQQIVKRGRQEDEPAVEFGPELRDLMAPYFVRSPACDPKRLVISHTFDDGDAPVQYYAWTTLDMLRTLYWWLHANSQIQDGVGKVFLIVDADHDVIKVSVSQGQRCNRTHRWKFDTAEGFVMEKMEQPAPEPRPKRKLRRESSTHLEGQQAAKAEAKKEAVKTVSGYCHAFVGTERKRCQRSLGYVHNTVPFVGIVCRSEGSGVVVKVTKQVLAIIAKDFGLKKCDVEGARADNGAAARLTVDTLSDGWKNGCLAHEIFKTRERNASWLKHFKEFKTFWHSAASLKTTPLYTHDENFNKEYNHWMHIAYRCVNEAQFRELGQLLADVAEEAGCQITMKHIKFKFGASRLVFSLRRLDCPVLLQCKMRWRVCMGNSKEMSLAKDRIPMRRFLTH